MTLFELVILKVLKHMLIADANIVKNKLKYMPVIEMHIEHSIQ